MVISDLDHLEETSQRVLGGYSILVTGDKPVEVEIDEPIYSEPEILKNGISVIRIIGWKKVKIIAYPSGYNSRGLIS